MREDKTVVLPVEILDDQNLSPVDFYILAQILRRKDSFGKISAAWLKPILKLSENTIRAGLITLAENGYLTKGPGRGTWLLNLKICGAEPQNLRYETSIPQHLKICGEEERTKEEDINNINNDFENEKDKENDKEKEIKKKEKPEGEEPDRFTAEYREIIGYLNEKTGKKFSARSRVNQGHMSARLKEGFTVEDFKRVIDIKCFQWLGDPKMAKFLRPETLFGTKFDRYLNEEKVVTRMGLHGEVYTVTEEEMNSPVPF